MRGGGQTVWGAEDFRVKKVGEEGKRFEERSIWCEVKGREN